MAAAISASHVASTSTWDEQIVPTLKKRLETESQYLSNRISTSGFQEHHDQTAAASGRMREVSGLGSGLGARSRGGGGYSGQGGETEMRQRTKSSPFLEPLLNSVSGQAGPSRIPVPTRYGNGNGNGNGTGRLPGQTASPGPSRRPSYNDTSDSDGPYPPSRIPRPHTGHRRPSGSSAISATLSSTPPDSPSLGPNATRTLSRPRSKSTLAPRPVVTRAASGSSQESQHRFPPSGIPVPVRNGQRAPPATALGSSVDRSRGYLSPNGPGTPGEGAQEILRHRKSFDLSTKVFLEPDLRDELPPFRLAPDEAMRIARHGHDLRGQGEEPDPGEMEAAAAAGGVSRGYGDRDFLGDGDGDGTSKRIRVESLHPTKHSGLGSGARLVPASEGMPRAGSSLGLGLGPAPSRSTGIAYKSNTNASSQQRSATTGTRSALTSSQTSTSRSISLSASTGPGPAGAAPTPPRYGVAAHFVPPESTYTPPKGANWDDVVLPALAKKMGLGQAEERRLGADEMEEGDLAVEWDKSGTPVKWVKRAAPADGSAHPLNASTGSGPPRPPQTREPLTEYEAYGNIPRSQSSFSPTFEPSPDNPLHPNPIRSAYPPTPTPVHHSQSRSLRTTAALDTAYTYRADEGPPAAPMPSAAVSTRRPDTGPAHSGITGVPAGLGPEIDMSAPEVGRGPSGSTSASRIQRKPSLLRQPVPALSHQSSRSSLRQPSQQPSPAGSRAGANPAQGLVRPADVAWDRQEREQRVKQQQQPVAPMSRPDQGPTRNAPGSRSKGDDASHGKGCGCVTM